MAKKVGKVFFFDYGQVVAFDESGDQIPEIQEKFWTHLVCERMEALGYDPAETTFTLSDGREARFAKVDGRWRML